MQLTDRRETKVLQNQLTKRLPADFLSQLPQGTAIAYASIPLIPKLEETIKNEVRVAFAESLRIVFFVFLGVSCAGLFVSLFMKHLPLHTSMNKDWALAEDKKRLQRDLELSDEST
jgi:hypothetical protein